jgi:hypothetical protein
MLFLGTQTNLVCEFWSTASGGTLIDRFTLDSNLHLTIRIETDAMRLSWPTNGAEGLVLEAATVLSPAAWQQVSQTASVTGGNHVVTLTATNQQQFFRLRR